MDQNTQQQQQQFIQKNPALKILFLTIFDYLKELFRKWYVYAIFLPLFFFLATLKKEKTYYIAESSFMSSDDGNIGRGMSGILGQIGFSSGGELETEKLAELITSKRMIQKALIKKININDSSKILFNHFLNMYDMETWLNNNGLPTDFKFTHNNVSKFDEKELIVAKKIYDKIQSEFLSVTTGKSNIIRVKFRSTSEKFSKEFTEQLVNVLSDYYIYKTAEKQNRAYRIIDNRIDSLEIALYEAENRIADWIDQKTRDRRAGNIQGKDVIDQQRLENKAEILSVMYAEAVKNREIALMNKLNHTPIIQIVDYPSYPLTKIEPNKLITLIKYIMAGFLLATIIIIFNKLVRDALKS